MVNVVPTLSVVAMRPPEQKPSEVSARDVTGEGMQAGAGRVR